LTDITARRRIEETLRFRLSLLDRAADHSLEELLQEMLDVIGTLTDSRLVSATSSSLTRTRFRWQPGPRVP